MALLFSIVLEDVHMTLSLFEGACLRLSAVDAERDAPVEARWTEDPAWQRALGDNLRDRSRPFM